MRNAVIRLNAKCILILTFVLSLGSVQDFTQIKSQSIISAYYSQVRDENNKFYNQVVE